MSHRELFESVRKRTGMYLREETYASVAAFVLGYDMACEGGILMGFREWLALRFKMGSNLGWEALVLHAAFPRSSDSQAEVHKDAGNQRVAIDMLFQLITEFAAERDKPDGLRKILVSYQLWLDEHGIG